MFYFEQRNCSKHCLYHKVSIPELGHFALILAGFINRQARCSLMEKASDTEIKILTTVAREVSLVVLMRPTFPNSIFAIMDGILLAV